MAILSRFGNFSPSLKIAVTWASWGTITLTGYYFARLWAHSNRDEALKIKQSLNDEIAAKLEEARVRSNQEEAMLKTMNKN